MAEQTLDEALEENLKGPLRASGDQGSFEQHDPAKVAEGIRFLESRKAAKKAAGGLKFTSLIPGGHE